MNVCRFDDGRLGVVEGQTVFDLSPFLDALPAHRWGFPLACPVIERLAELGDLAQAGLDRYRAHPLAEVSLQAPVPRPSKIIGAPVNYHAHLDEARADVALHQGREVHPIDEIGLFLKANSALAGPSDPITVRLPERRTDHEAEVAVIIGRTADGITRDVALDYVAGYCLALDLSVRGKEDRSMRKSPDGYAVLGPWLVTADEIADPGRIDFQLQVNGEERQRGSTSALIRSVPELIEMASRFYTLHPGDVIMTGTPQGVAPIGPGDHLRLSSTQLGTLEVSVRA